jgi:hypothetical protein
MKHDALGSHTSSVYATCLVVLKGLFEANRLLLQEVFVCLIISINIIECFSGSKTANIHNTTKSLYSGQILHYQG